MGVRVCGECAQVLKSFNISIEEQHRDALFSCFDVLKFTNISIYWTCDLRVEFYNNQHPRRQVFSYLRSVNWFAFCLVFLPPIGAVTLNRSLLLVLSSLILWCVLRKVNEHCINGTWANHLCNVLLTSEEKPIQGDEIHVGNLEKCTKLRTSL